DQEVETIEHLLLKCSFVREVWFKVFDALGWVQRLPPTHLSFVDWWLLERKRFDKRARRGFDALLLLVVWIVWKERNDRIFRRRASMPRVLLEKVVKEAGLWAMAGVVDIGLLLAGVSASA
ncbi:hypothetical protein BS78_01G028100, partial [Paspalum vaginatum]